MSTICGIYKTGEEKVKKEDVRQMMDVLSHWEPDSEGVYVDKSIGFGHLLLYNTQESKYEKQPLHSGKLLITADTRLERRRELADKLMLKDKKCPDSTLIIKAYETWGEACVNYLEGEFAFAIWDQNHKKLFCARDHIGFRPFFYYHDKEQFIFSSEMKGIMAVYNSSFRLNEKWVADTLSTLKSDHDQAPYNGIYRLPPAHTLTISGEKPKLQRYWDFNPSKKVYLKSESEYIEAFREKLIQSVREKINSPYPVGAELSGGVDSSSVCAVACGMDELPEVITFSHVLPDSYKLFYPAKDEKEYILKVCGFSQVAEKNFITSEDKDILNNFRDIVKIQDAATQQKFHAFSDALYERAEQCGVRTLLSGFGGDEMVSSHGGGFLNELSKQKDWQKLWHQIKNQDTIKKQEKVKRMVGHYLKGKMPGVYDVVQKVKPQHKKNTLLNAFKQLPLTEELISSNNLKTRFIEKKMGYPDLDMTERQYTMISRGNTSLRLEYCNIAAKHYKVEYRYPLLDKNLMEFYIAIPSEFKIKEGWGRYVLRKAMEGYLPEEIQWRNDKSGATIPSVYHRLVNDHDNIIDFIRLAEQKEIAKKYIDYNKLQNLSESVVKLNKKKIPLINPGIFFNAIEFLIFQENRMK